MMQSPHKLSNLTIMGILWARLYYAFAKEIIERMGPEEGRKLLVHCIKRFAMIRGKAVADYVKQQNLPYDAESFVRNYDSCFEDVQKAFLGDFHNTTLPKCKGVSFCPYLEIWEEFDDGKELALIYCEEFHKAMWAAYHPYLRVRQDQIKARNDSVCTFLTYMEGDEDNAIGIFDQN